MHHAARVWRWFVAVVRKRPVERTIQAEIDDHLAREIDWHIARGVPAADARRLALADFGAVEGVKDAVRDTQARHAFTVLAADCRYGARVLRRYPSLSVTALLTLGAGIGLTGAIATVVYGVLLRPLPYSRPDQLVVLWEQQPQRGKLDNVVSPENADVWRRELTSVGGMARLMPTTVTIDRAGVLERVIGAEVTPGYFTMLGVAPARGRDFNSADAASGQAVILSHAYWRDQLGADESAVGGTLRIAGRPFTIVGVMPEGFEPPRFGWLGDQPLWLPMVEAEHRQWGRHLLVVGRLQPGATLARAARELAAVSARHERDPGNDGWTAGVQPLATAIAGDSHAVLLTMFAAVTLLLLMAVSNVAALTLTSIRRRTRELAIRRAIGATDGRIFRQLFVQSLLLGAAGTAVGLVVAAMATPLFVAVLPQDLPRLESVRFDAPVILMLSAASLLATVVFGVVAGRADRRLSLSSMLSARTDSAVDAPGRATTGALITGEIALAVIVSVMALLMVRSVASLQTVDLGFDGDRVLAVRLAAPGIRYGTPDAQRALFDLIRQRFAAVPGVDAVGLMSQRPFDGGGPADSVADLAAPAAEDASKPVADVRVVDAGAFRALGVPIVKGRAFDRLSDASGPVRAVINDTLARALWPGADPIGRRLSMHMYNGITPEVIGVAGDMRILDARTPPRAEVFLFADRFLDGQRDVVIRTAGAPEDVLPALRAVMAEIAPDVPLYRARSLRTTTDRSLATDRFAMLLLSLFAGVALLLAAIGVFGVCAADVTARRREIGVRLALGGSARGVLWFLLRRAWRRASAGLIAGVALALAAAQAMQALLFGITPGDPLSLALAAAAVIALTTLATVLPARTALQRSPVETLREP